MRANHALENHSEKGRKEQNKEISDERSAVAGVRGRGCATANMGLARADIISTYSAHFPNDHALETAHPSLRSNPSPMRPLRFSASQIIY